MGLFDIVDQLRRPIPPIRVCLIRQSYPVDHATVLPGDHRMVDIIEPSILLPLTKSNEDDRSSWFGRCAKKCVPADHHAVPRIVTARMHIAFTMGRRLRHNDPMF